MRVSTPLRRVVPAHCRHLSASHSRDQANHVGVAVDHAAGSPVAGSKV